MRMLGLDPIGLFQSLIAFAGLVFVAVQLRHSAKLAKINLIFQLNERLAGYAADIEVMLQLSSPEDYKALGATQRTRILDYITVFENMESMRRLNALTADDINDFFAGRIVELLDSPGVQNAIFYNPEVGSLFAPIFSLHNFWLRSLKRRRIERPPTLTPFENGDPEFYTAMVAKALA